MSSNIWTYTPLRESLALSEIAGCRIFLKLETSQPSGSFKYRGTSNLMLSALDPSLPPSHQAIHYYCSSGGNAGIACATSARSLGLPATICVPLTTSPRMVKKLKTLGAEVYQTGKSWSEADLFLREELLAKDPTGFYIPPFDHPVIWEGASSLCEEVYEQMAPEGGFDGIVCSVGGGSLLTGIMSAISRHPDKSTPQVLAVETRGAESLNASLVAGQHLTLPSLSSIATSLSIARVASRAYELAQKPNVHSIVLSDAEAAMGAVRFYEDEELMVEVSCGVALAALYNGSLRRECGKGMSDENWKGKKYVVAVCGGSDVSEELLREYREKYEALAPSMVSTTKTGEILAPRLVSSVVPSLACAEKDFYNEKDLSVLVRCL